MIGNIVAIGSRKRILLRTPWNVAQMTRKGERIVNGPTLVWILLQNAESLGNIVILTMSVAVNVASISMAVSEM